VEEQEWECAAGNPNAKDWHDEALMIMERTMEDYWKTRDSPTTTHLSASITPGTAAVVVPGGSHSDAATMESEFDHHRHLLLIKAMCDHDAGWAEELRRYLEVMPNVSKDMDIIHWWSVSAQHLYYLFD
jgi:hypothetical protein